MAHNPKNTFGFELLYKVSGDQIIKREDVLVLLVHWYLIKDGFKCLGIGDSKTLGSNEVGSEILPDRWNQAPNYTLRYVREGKLYILLGTKSEADLLLNLLRIEDHEVANVQFPVETVKELKGSLESMIPSYDSILPTLETYLVCPFHLTNTVDVPVQTEESTLTENRPGRNDDDPLRVGPLQRSQRPRATGDPSEIGRGDLDPCGIGGGMLFDPFAQRTRPRISFPGLGVPGRLPPGAIPPGARFDPFGPPDVDPPIPRARAPDADHMPPPGYDDMFM